MPYVLCFFLDMFGDFLHLFLFQSFISLFPGRLIYALLNKELRGKYFLHILHILVAGTSSINFLKSSSTSNHNRNEKN